MEVYIAKISDDSEYYVFTARYLKAAVDANMKTKLLKDACLVQDKKLSRTLKIMETMTEILENE